MDAPLPEGMTARPLTVEDVDSVVAMVNACEVHDTGQLMWERTDLLADSGTDGFDLGRDWIGVFDGDMPVGFGMIVHRRSAWVYVDPGARGRGIGTWLRAWTVQRARQIGSPRIGQTVDDRLTAVAAMFRAAGYTPRHTSWVLRKDHDGPEPDPRFPAGAEAREFRPGDEVEALTMFEEAFREFDDREPSSLATWRAMTVDREDFAPENLILAVRNGRIVGGAFLLDGGAAFDEIWVDKLAVHRDHRRLGIAQGLMRLAFARAVERGYSHTGVSTDSRTGALDLYEHVGMRVVESHTHYGLDLT